MLNYLWACMILIGILFGAATGKMEEITNAALDSAGEAVSLCITMLGVMAFWMGLMEIAQKAKLIEKMTNKIQPFITMMFPHIPKNHIAREYISTNIIANILGLGWACTPAGLKAMEALSQLEAERGNPAYLETANIKKKIPVRSASEEMCTFLVINISSLQLIPVNIIAYRSQYGSLNPAAIVGPSIVATSISTIVALIFCKFMCIKKRGSI